MAGAKQEKTQAPGPAGFIPRTDRPVVAIGTRRNDLGNCAMSDATPTPRRRLSRPRLRKLLKIPAARPVGIDENRTIAIGATMRLSWECSDREIGRYAH